MSSPVLPEMWTFLMVRLSRPTKRGRGEVRGLPPFAKNAKDGAPSVRVRRQVKTWVTEVRSFPPFRRKKGERMGHGTFVLLPGKNPTGAKAQRLFCRIIGTTKVVP